MAKKRKKTEAKRAPTKRQLSRWQQQKKMQRIIVIAGSIFFALIVALGGYGIYAHSFKNLNQPVLKVNDMIFNMDYYVDALTIFLQSVDSEQIPAMADFTLDTILQNELLIQNAAELGVDVGSDEVDAIIKQLGQPNTKVYRDMHKANILVEKLLDNYFRPKVPTTVEQVKVEALVAETIEKAEEVREIIGNSDNFTSAVEMFSVEPTTIQNNGDLGWLPKGMIGVKFDSLADSKLEDFVFDLEPGVLSQPTYDPSISKGSGYWILEVLEKDEAKSAHVRGILLGSMEEAQQTKANLESGGDFASLARQISQHQESGEFDGDLGWVQKGFGNEIINKVAFELEPGAISEPIYDDTVSTKGGYWLVKVLDKDDERALEEEITDRVIADAFTEWFDELRDKSQIEEYLDEEQKSWAIDRALRNIGA